MNELTYEQLYESCEKELAQQLDLSTNKDHFVACFRNLEEEDLLVLFKNQNNDENFLRWIKMFLSYASNYRVGLIAQQNALALMEDLS